MRAASILRRLLLKSIAEVHARRREAVFAAVEAAIAAQSLVLARVGRALCQRTSPKHGIKRADRLFANPRLLSERAQWYRAVAAHLLAGNSRPIVLVDWTETNGGPSRRFDALVAAVPVGTRSIPIHSRVVPHRDNNKRHVHAAFLRELEQILPDGARPIVVTDAGFRTTWYQLVEAMGWDYVGRVRGGLQILMDDEWLDSKAVYRSAKSKAWDLGTRKLTRKRQLVCRLVLAKKTKKRSKPRRRRIRQERAAKGAREPWLLATSLTGSSVQEVIDIYRKRMGIEEAFRDNKSHRFGWSLRDCRTKTAERMSVQLLLATLTTFVATLVGYAAERSGLHRRFQASSIRHRRVLSWRTLGTYVLQRTQGRPLFYISNPSNLLRSD